MIPLLSTGKYLLKADMPLRALTNSFFEIPRKDKPISYKDAVETACLMIGELDDLYNGDFDTDDVIRYWRDIRFDSNTQDFINRSIWALINLNWKITPLYLRSLYENCMNGWQ